MDSLGHHTSGADVDLVGAAFQAQLALISSNLFSTYLMALAAHHRGLPVTFVKSLRNISARWQKLADFELPKSFIVAHGHHTHSFNITIGDRTGLTAALLAGDKNRTKLMLARAGLPVSAGISVKAQEFRKARGMMAAHPDARFVLKPIAGSLGKGVHNGLAAQEVFDLLSIKTIPEMVLEVQVSGNEYRAFVVGNRVAAAFQRWPAQVVGNGRDSIAVLIASKNWQRAQNLNLVNKLINPLDAAKLLAIRQRRMTDIPVLGERVLLADAANTASGGDIEDATHHLPEAAAAIAVAAARVVGLPTAGVDLFHDPQTNSVVVLELNSRPQIGGHSFPSRGTGSGNVVAEAVMDFYFPATAAFPRQPGRVLDMKAVVDAFAAGAPSVTVPPPV